VTPFLPLGLGRGLTATLALAALPDAPTRTVAARRSRWRRVLRRLTEGVGPTEAQRTEPVKADPYAAWRGAARLSAHALRRWSRAAPSNRALAHAVYQASLEAEDAAAVELARWSRRRDHR
jgi:hypothetical protein